MSDYNVTWDYQYLRNKGMELYRERKYGEAIWQFNLAISALGWQEAPLEFPDLHKLLYRSTLLRDARGIDHLIKKNHYEEAVEHLQTLAKYFLDPWIHNRLKECRKYTLRPFNHPNGFAGYENDYGEEIIPPTFVVAEEFQKGRAVVSTGYCLKIINRSGELLTDRGFDLIFNTRGGFTTVAIIAEKDYKYNLIDSKGNLHLKKWYDFVSPHMEDGLRTVMENEKYGCVCPNGEIRIPIIYDFLFLFSEGFAGAKKEGKFGFIDRAGNVVVPFEFESIGGGFCEELASVKKKGKWGFIDRGNNEVISCEWDEAICFSEERAAVKRDGLWGMINPSGEVVIPFLFDDVYEHPNGIAIVEIGKEYYFINRKGVLLGDANYYFEEVGLKERKDL